MDTTVQMPDEATAKFSHDETRKRLATRVREVAHDIEKMAKIMEGGVWPADLPYNSTTRRAMLLRDLADAHERAGVIAGRLAQIIAPEAGVQAQNALVAAATVAKA